MVYSLLKIYNSILNNSLFTVYGAAGLVFFNTPTCVSLKIYQQYHAKARTDSSK
jgi:hypothetical protein